MGTAWVIIDGTPDFQFGGDQELNYLWFPVILVGLLAWFISHEILGLYDTAVDTILLNFCQDRKLNKLKKNHETKTNPKLSEFVQKHSIKDMELQRQYSEHGI